MDLLASKFSWKILKKLVLQAPQEPSDLASDEEVGGGDTDGVQGIDQQGGCVEVQDLEEQMNSSSSEILATEEMSEYEKIRATNVKQKEELLKQLKRDWQGLKENEGFVTGGGQKRAKKLKVVEKEIFNTRSKAKRMKGKEKEAAHLRSVENVGTHDQLRDRDLATSGTGLDNGSDTYKVVFPVERET